MNILVCQYAEMLLAQCKRPLKTIGKNIEKLRQKSDKGGWVMQLVENNGCISPNSTHAWLLGCTSRDFKWTVVGKQFKIEIVPQLALIVF